MSCLIILYITIKLLIGKDIKVTSHNLSLCLDNRAVFSSKCLCPFNMSLEEKKSITSANHNNHSKSIAMKSRNINDGVVDVFDASCRCVICPDAYGCFMVILDFM